jgi:diguanylate cyclase (GGDEF)-like protein/PAS domain S-box-containing protein
MPRDEVLFAPATGSSSTSEVVDTDSPAASIALDGRLLDANDALCRLVGRRRRDLVGRDLRTLALYPTDAQRGQRALAAARGGTPCGGFTQHWHQDGDRPPLRLRLVWTLVRDADGVPESLRVFCLDQDQQAATARFWQALLAESSDITWTADERGVLTTATPGAVRQIGRPLEELVGTSLLDLAHPEDRAVLSDAWARVVGGSGREVVEYRLAHARRSWTPVRQVLTDHRHDPDVRAVVGNAIDLHDALEGQRDTAPTDSRPDRRRLEARRERQETFFLALAQRAGDLALVTDADGLVLYTSPALAAKAGWSPEDLVVLGSADHVHPEDRRAATAAFARVLRQGVTETITLRALDAEGRWRWMEATASNLLDTAVGGMLWNLRDVDDRVRAEAALRASEARYRAIADSAEEGLWVIAPDGRTVYVNNRLVEILGLEADDTRERPLLDLLDPAGHLQRVRTGAVERSPERYEVSYQHPDGRRRTLRVSAAPLDDRGGTVEGSLAMVSDVTDGRRLEDELRRAALHDTLTGLPNRALLFDRLQHALMRETRSTSVLFVDLDQFRHVNEVWGHAVGDELLVRVAARLQAGVRATDTVARFAGDEFLVVCEDVDERSARMLANSLLTALEEPYDVSEGDVRLSASIGVATSPTASAEDLLSHADTAMHAAKAAGRNRVRVFDAGLAADTEDHRLGGDLRRALNGGELSLHHQPVVDLRTGRVVGTEALARWTHPVHGVVSPDRFVSVAERVGLAPELDRWALQRALADARALRARGAMTPDGYVAVNLSAYTLCDARLDAWIAQVVRVAGFAPEEVLLEVTESAVMADAPTAVGVLTRLRQRGFPIAVDDFGTGHSSLAYLRNLPLTTLKIDRSFVAEIATDASARAIVASIVELARAVGLTVVAEGVETPEDAVLLQSLGCDAAQGWLWSRAVSPEEACTTGALAHDYPLPHTP